MANFRLKIRGSAAAPVTGPNLVDVAYEFGTFTYPGMGYVNLSDLMLTPGGETVTSWSATYRSDLSTRGAAGANDFTVDTASGLSPTRHASSVRTNITGDYYWDITATSASGSKTKQLKITAVTDALSFGNPNQNWEGANLGMTAATAVSLGLQKILIQPGWARPQNSVVIGTGWDFSDTAKVIVRYAASTTSPSRVATLNFQGSGNLSFEDFSFNAYGTDGNAHIYVGGPGCQILRCNFLESLAGFTEGPNNGGGWACVSTTSAADGLVIRHCRARHKLLGVVGDAKNVLIEYCHWDKFHRTGIFVGTAATDWLVQYCLFTNPWRTLDPFDTGNHLDWFQLADSTSTTAQRITCQYCIFIMGNATAAVRGWAGSGTVGAANQVQDTIFRNNIMTTWGIQVFENYGFKGTANLTENNVFMFMQTGNLHASDSIQNGYDYFGVGPTIVIGRDPSDLNYPGPGYVDSGASWIVRNNYSEGDLLIRGEAIGKVTSTGNSFWNRNFSGFASDGWTEVSGPRAKLESYGAAFWESDDETMPYLSSVKIPQQIAAAKMACRRASGGPIDISGNWNP